MCHAPSPTFDADTLVKGTINLCQLRHDHGRLFGADSAAAHEVHDAARARQGQCGTAAAYGTRAVPGSPCKALCGTKSVNQVIPLADAIIGGVHAHLLP